MRYTMSCTRAEDLEDFDTMARSGQDCVLQILLLCPSPLLALWLVRDHGATQLVVPILSLHVWL